MTAESEKLHGDVLRAPQVVKPAAAAPGPTAPAVTVESVRVEIVGLVDELTALYARMTDDTTAREWDDIAARIERVSRVASQSARWARTLAMRAHVALR